MPMVETWQGLSALVHASQVHTEVIPNILLLLCLSKTDRVSWFGGNWRSTRLINLRISCLLLMEEGQFKGHAKIKTCYYAGINLTGYHPPGRPGAFAPKCVPSPMAFAQQNVPRGRIYKWRNPWGRAFASTGLETLKLLTQSSGLKLSCLSAVEGLVKSRRLRTQYQAAYFLSAHKLAPDYDQCSLYRFRPQYPSEVLLWEFYR